MLPKPKSITFAQMIDETLSAKRAANRRERYVKGLAQFLRQFGRGREHLTLSQFTASDIERFFDASNSAPSTRVSNLGRLSALFGLAKRRGYISENPCDRVEKATVEKGQPHVLTLEQCRLLLDSVKRDYPKYMAYLTLALFAGIRPEEITRLTWDAIDLEQKQVRLTVTKTRTARIVPLSDNAVAWLKIGGRLPLAPIAKRRAVKRMRAILGLPHFPQDVLRHTAASMLLAFHQDAGRVAFWLGNSPSILMRHYWSLTTSETARQFFAMFP